MNPLVIILVAVGVLAAVAWLIASVIRDSNSRSGDGSSTPTDLGDGTSHSHDSSDAGGSDGGGGDGGGGD